MNNGVKALWIEALRNGGYTKTEGVLYRKGNKGEPDCHCALGVLCEEAAKAGVIQVDETAELNDRFPEPPTNRFIPEEVAQWAGIEDVFQVEFPVQGRNDSGRFFGDGSRSGQSTFDEIADLIERIA